MLLGLFTIFVLERERESTSRVGAEGEGGPGQGTQSHDLGIMT